MTPNFSMRMTALAAALLRPQLAELPRRVARWNAIHDRIAAGLRRSQHLRVPERGGGQVYSATSVQFSAPGFEADDMERFLALAKARGLPIKWFGAARQAGFTSAPRHWRYAGEQGPLAATHETLATLCDIRTPVSLTDMECDLIAEIARDSIAAVAAARAEGHGIMPPQGGTWRKRRREGRPGATRRTPMKRLLAGKFLAGLALAAVMAGAAPAGAQAPAPIGVSYQPSLYWALPFHYANVKGWWKDVGLAPNFSTFPAGAPQVAAAAAKSWDVGGTGSVPAVLGAVRFNILTIGITNDESKTNAMMVRGDKFDAIKANPASLKGPAPAADHELDRGLRLPQMPREDGPRAQRHAVRQSRPGADHHAITSNNGDIAGVWAPNTYTLEDQAKARYLCSGADAGAIVPGRAHRARRFRQGASGRCRQVSRGLPARLVVGQGQPGRGAHAGARLLQAGRPRGDGPRHGPGIRAASRPSASTSS